MNDEELKDLFSAFEEVSASESLKSATLKSVLAASMAAAATTAPVATATAAVTADEVAVPEELHARHANPEGGRVVCADVAEPRAQVQARMPEKPVFKATAGKARHKRAKRRTVRVAALAACFVLALSGGVAFATPTSYVTVSQGGTTIELGVNSFGFAITATASDEVGQKILDESTGLLNVPYQDSVSRVSDSLKEVDPGVSVDVDGDTSSRGARSGSGDKSQKADMQSEQFGAPRDSMSSALVEYDWGGGGSSVPSMEAEPTASASPSKSAPAVASSSSSASSGSSGSAIERRISIDQVVSGVSEVVTQPMSVVESNPTDSGDDAASDQSSDSGDDQSGDSGDGDNGSSVRTSSVDDGPDANDDEEASDDAA